MTELNDPAKRDASVNSLTFYAACWLCTLSGIGAISSAVNSFSFFALASLLASLGYLTSIKLRKRGRNVRIIEAIVIAICLATYARLFTSGQTNPLLNPGNALFHKELSLAVMLVWAETVRTFSLVSDEALLFTIVPALALIGVVATTSSGSDVLVFFTVWLCATCLMFIENGRKGIPRSPSKKPVKLAALAAFIGVASIIGGLVVSPALQTSSLWMIMKIAPGIYTARRAIDIPGDEPEMNVLAISDGPVRLSDRVEMMVKAEDGAYWRTRVWDVYSGRDWQSSVPGSVQHPHTTLSDSNEFVSYQYTERRSRSTLKQKITLYNRTGTYLPAASEPRQIRIWSDVLITDEFNCWRAPATPGQNSLTYEVISEVPEATQQQLMEAPTNYDTEIRRYLEVPLGTEQVQKLVNTLTAGVRQPYRKMQILQNYLAINCTYDINTPPIPIGERDAVSYFLFNSKRGYCDVFASALAIMGRCAGVPTRLTTGYMTGEYVPSDGTYVVREKDRHSWVEIYFPGYGWIPFEATQGADATGTSFWRSLMTEISRIPSTTNTMLISLLGILLVSLYLLQLSDDPRKRYSKDRLPKRVFTREEKTARRTWKHLAKLLNGVGVRAKKYHTPLDLANLAKNSLPNNAENAKEAIKVTAELIEAILFSGRDDLTEEIDDLHAAWQWTLREIRALKTSTRVKTTP